MSSTFLNDIRQGIAESGSKVKLLPLFLVVRAPGGVGTLRMVTGAAPVPLAAITQEDVLAQSFLYSEFEFVYPVGVIWLHFAWM